MHQGEGKPKVEPCPAENGEQYIGCSPEDIEKYNQIQGADESHVTQDAGSVRAESEAWRAESLASDPLACDTPIEQEVEIKKEEIEAKENVSEILGGNLVQDEKKIDLKVDNHVELENSKYVIDHVAAPNNKTSSDDYNNVKLCSPEVWQSLKPLCVKVTRVPRLEQLVASVAQSQEPERLVLKPVCSLGSEDSQTLHMSQPSRRTSDSQVGRRTFKNVQCGKQFTYKCHLRIHWFNKHSKEKPYKCKTCELRFKHEFHLRIHIRDNHSGFMRECEFCNFSTKNKRCFLNHQRLHLPNTRFPCNICRKVFNKEELLVEHRRSHFKVKPFKCSKCGRCFESDSALTSHQAVHSQSKPLSCDKCDKSFFTQGVIINTRTPEKGLLNVQIVINVLSQSKLLQFMYALT